MNSKKEEVILYRNTKTIWSIKDYFAEEYYEQGEGDIIKASYYLKGEFLINDENLFIVEFWTEPSYLMDSCRHFEAKADKVIKESDFGWLIGVDKMKDLSEVCYDYYSFIEVLDNYDILDDAVCAVIYGDYPVNETDDDVDVTIGPLAFKWVKKDEFMDHICDALSDKVLRSNISGEKVEVVKRLPAEIEDGKVLFDGMRLFDGVQGIEDDIQQMSAMTKDGEVVNLEDYYTENGAFEDGEEESFFYALEELMTVDEFIAKSTELKYP